MSITTARWLALRTLSQYAREKFAAHRFLRFLIVGGANTAVAYGLLWCALAVVPTTFVALCLSTILAILFSFATNRTVVFGDHSSGRTLPNHLTRFFAVYGLVFAYNAVGLEMLERAGINPRIGGLLLLPGAVLVSYILNRRHVFVGVL